MKLLKRMVLLSLCAIVAIAAGAAMSALIDRGIIKIAPSAKVQVAQEPAREVPPVVEMVRVTLAPIQKTPQVANAPIIVQPPPVEPVETSEEPAAEDSEVTNAPAPNSEAANPETWSADVKPEPAARPADVKQAALQPEQLPWKAAPSAAPPSSATAPKVMTLSERLAEISPSASKRLTGKFKAAEAAWPPTDIALVAIKDEKALELYAKSSSGAWQYVHSYKVLAASGTLGPKLRKGDLQVPEGVYGIAFINPNSKYHVALRLDYPNSLDKQMAALDGRENLGGDIMIHGKNVSAGCLAVGDEAAEELVVLTAQIGLPHVKIVIAPTDLRSAAAPELQPGQPKWLPKLYVDLASTMTEFKKPPGSILSSLLGSWGGK